ncbi:MAG: anaerobic ribonucleoside-triphosphate reductase activating protein [Planctomycetota bacterium]
MKRTPPILGIIETSLTHWAGQVCSVVFVNGCTLRCPTCPAPHLVGWGEAKGRIPLDSVLDAIYRRRRWVDGVVVKGGEPLAHPEIDEFLELLKDFGLAVRVDTNGTRPVVLKDLIRRQLVDFVSMDLKAPLGDVYHRVAGTEVDLAALFDSIEILLSGEVEYEFRTAVYDGLLTEEDVISIARTIRGARRYVLRAVPQLGPSRARLRRLARRAGRHVSFCHVEGRTQDREPAFVFVDGQGAGGR